MLARKRRQTEMGRTADETTLRKFVAIVAATARARSVFPVPGGPYRSTPLGALMPTRCSANE